ncbi:MAG: DUF5615 family PIN-like protein [Bryobacteraceae bacterium]|jgi:hypothetical protein
MSRVRLYLDEDSMRKSLVFGLRARGVDVLTAAEADMVNRPDEEHLALAAGSGRAVFTFNTGDYCTLHQLWMGKGRTHAGIVVSLQQRYTVGEELRRIARLIGLRTAEQMANRLEFLSSWG